MPRSMTMRPVFRRVESLASWLLGKWNRSAGFFRLRIAIQEVSGKNGTRSLSTGHIDMKNGLYSIQIRMLDGVKGRASGVLVLRDGTILGGDPYFWSAGTYTVGNGTWKGEIVTHQHTPYHESDARPVFGGREVATGFSGTFQGGTAEVFGTSLVGSRSVS